MARIFVKYADATSYTPADDKTFGEVVAEQCPDVTWRELALYNWGTDVNEEVNRALIELYGCSVIDEADCLNTKFNATFAAAGVPRTMYIPKPWKQDSADLEKTHT